MGSPLGPVFASIFLSFHEETWLDNCPKQFKSIYYKRYVDDCFTLFKSQDHVIPFLNDLNSKHHRIKFTHEVGSNKTLAFLDINISRSRGGFISSVYRKLTFTGLITNFESFLPFVYKKGFIFTLFRYFNLCSSSATFHDELQCFQTLLNQNGCPSRFVEKCIRDFLDKTFSPPVKQNTAPKYLLSFLLPFTGNHALQIRQQLIKLMLSAYPHINLRIIFRPTFRLPNFFSV